MKTVSLDKCWLLECEGTPVQFIIRYEHPSLEFLVRVEARCVKHVTETNRTSHEVTREQAISWLLLHSVHES